MSSSVVDEKIIKLTLQYNSLKQGAEAASGVLSKLKDKISALGDTKLGQASAEGISKIKGAADTAIGGISQLGEKAVGVASRFDALKTVATGALLTIGSTAVQKGAEFIKSLTLDPVMDGFKEYEAKVKSTQTIMTNTGRSIEDVNKVLDELNTYSDKTIYKFSDMTTAIGSMASAGIGLEDASTVVKGFYNAAAATGVEASRMGSLLQTALIPSLSRGYMGLQDFRQLSDAGFGQGFKDTVLEVAESMGIQVDKATAFNDALKDGWLTTDVLIEATRRFEANDAYKDAATKVKTFSDLLDTVGESVGSGWAKSWEIIIGNMDEASKIFTPLQQEIDGIVQGLNNMRDNFLLAFKAAGGFQAILNTGQNIYRFFKQIVVAIMDAWKSVTVLGEGFGKLPGLLATPFKIIEAITRKIADFKLIPTVIGGAFKVLFTVLSPIMMLLIKTGEAVMFVWNKLMVVVKMVTGLFTDLGKAIKGMYIKEVLLDSLSNFIRLLKQVTVEPITKLLSVFYDLGKAIADSVKAWSIEPLKEWASGAREAILGVFDSFKKLDFKSIFKPLKDSFDGFFRTMGESATIKAFTAQMQLMKDAINNIKTKYLNFDWMKDIKQLQPLRDFANVLKNLKIEEYFARPVRILKDQLSKLSGPLKVVKDMFGNLGDALRNAFKGWSIQPIIDWFNKLKDAVSELFNNVKRLNFKSILNGFSSGLTSIVDKIANTDLVKGLITQFNKLKDVLSKLGVSVDFSWVKDLIVVQQAKKWIDDLKDGFTALDLGGKFKSAKDAISDFKDLIASFDLAETIKFWNDELQAFLDSIDFGPAVELINDFTMAIVKAVKAFGKWAKETIATPAFTFIQNGIKKVINWFKKLNATKVGEATSKGIEKLSSVTTKASDKIAKAGDIIRKAIGKIGEYALTGFKYTVEGLKSLWDGVSGFAQGLAKVLGAIVYGITHFATLIKEKLGPYLTTENLLKGGVILWAATVLKSMKRLSKSGSGLMDSIAGMFDGFGKIGDVLEGIQKAFKNFTKNVTPGNILKVAGAIAILALSIKLLSTIDVDKLPSTLGLLGSAITAMTGSLLLIDKFGKNPTTMLAAAGSMQGIATAVLIMAGALKVISTIKSDDLGRSIQAIGSIFAMLAGAVAVISIFGKSVDVSVKGMVGLAGALVVMAYAVKAFADIPTDDLIKGGIATGLALGAVVIAMKALNKVKLGVGIALSVMAMAKALEALAEPVKIFGSMDLPTLAKGLIATGLALAGMVIAFQALDKVNTIGSATSMLVVAGALNLIAIPIKMFGSMDLWSLAKGLGTMGGALGMITLALMGLGMMQGSAMSGAGAILAVVGAINLLIPPIVILGTLKFSTIAQGLGVIAVALLGIVGIGYLANGAVLGLGGIASALGAIALAAIGIGAVLYITITALDFLASSSKDAFESLVNNVLTALQLIAEKAPEFGDAFLIIISEGLHVLRDSVIEFANVGLDIILGLLQAIRDHIYEIATVASEIAQEFMRALGDQAEPLAMAGAELIIALINGLSTAIDEHGNELIVAVLNLTQSILNVVIDALAAVVEALFGWIPGVGGKAKELGDAAKDGLEGAFNRAKTSLIGEEAAQGTVDGIESKTGDANKAGSDVMSAGVDGLGSGDATDEGDELGSGFVDSLGNLAGDADDAGTDVASMGVDGLGSQNATSEGNALGLDFTGSLGSKGGEAYSKAKGVANRGKAGFGSVSAKSSGENFGSGFASGISNMWDKVSTAASGLASRAKGAVEKILAIFSPSRVMRKDGGYFGEGFILGINDKETGVEKASVNMATTAIDGVRNTMEGVNDAIYDVLDTQPVIAPVVDTSGVKMGDLSGVTKAFTNTTFEGTVSYEAKLLDKFNQMRNDITQAVKDTRDKTIVVKNFMDGREIGELVAKPVSDAQAQQEQLLNAIYGKGF